MQPSSQPMHSSTPTNQQISLNTQFQKNNNGNRRYHLNNNQSNSEINNSFNERRSTISSSGGAFVEDNSGYKGDALLSEVNNLG